MKNIYDVTCTRQHCDTKEMKTREYQVVGDNLVHAVFQAGQVFHNEMWDVTHIFVSAASILKDEVFEWNLSE
jgi:hypothetical protein